MADKKRKLPLSASVSINAGAGRLRAPSAARNIDAIIGVLTRHAPRRGRALEIASGTGEHIIRYSKEFPALFWQPTDIDPQRIASIQGWAELEGSANLAKPILLDATIQGWADTLGSFDLIILANLLHLISAPEAKTLLAQAATALAPGGVFLIYGPFMRGMDFASDADRSFHASLRSTDPEIGYKPFQGILDALMLNDLKTDIPTEMPANNLMLIARKPG